MIVRCCQLEFRPTVFLFVYCTDSVLFYFLLVLLLSCFREICYAIWLTLAVIDFFV